MPICSRRPYCFDWECISRFLKNGATPASFCLFSFVSNTISYRKIASFSGIQTQMASTLTTTAHVWVVWRSFYIKSILTFLFSRSDANKLFNILLSSSLVARPQCDRMVRLFFNILPFVAKKISQICQSILSNLPNTRKLLQSTRKLLLKWRNFAKSGHTARPQKYFPFLKKIEPFPESFFIIYCHFRTVDVKLSLTGFKLQISHFGSDNCTRSATSTAHKSTSFKLVHSTFRFFSLDYVPFAVKFFTVSKPLWYKHEILRRNWLTLT